MAEDMKQYQNALEAMSSEAVEYVRGIPVVKTFGQTIYTFKRFKAAIDEYEKWTLGYTKNMMLPMVAFTTAANAIFAVIIIAAFIFTSNSVTDNFILNLFFYMIITSVLTVTLMKVAYAGESQMIVDDALNRMYEILETKPFRKQKKKNYQKIHLLNLIILHLHMKIHLTMQLMALVFRLNQENILPLLVRQEEGKQHLLLLLHASGT